MNFSQVVEQINQKPVMPTWTPSLEGMRTALTRLNLPIEKFRQRTILVAGTNGKGSVSKTLSHLLESQGFKTHLFTSPHLVNIRERFQIHEKWISEEDFTASYLRVREKLGDLQVSHFETLTLMAADYFTQEADEKSWFIYEIGMGGVWDATNAIPHAYSVITTIGHDHQKFLGHSLAEIAANKFGIIEPNNQVFTGFLPEEIYPQLENICREKSAALCRLDIDQEFQEEFFYFTDKNTQPPEFFLEWKDQRFALALPGERGFENSLLALYILHHLKISPRAVLPNLKSVNWPGRMSMLKVPGTCPVYLSGDHNPEGISSLLEVLKNYNWEKLHILSAISEGRTADAILNPLFALPRAQIYLTKNPFKPLSLEDYQKWSYFSTWQKMKGIYEEDCLKAFTDIQAKAQSGDLILVTGSLYLTGAILEKFSS